MKRIKEQGGHSLFANQDKIASLGHNPLEKLNDIIE